MAVNKQIKLLALSLGLTLFERTTRKMALPEIEKLFFLNTFIKLLYAKNSVVQILLHTLKNFVFGVELEENKKC